MADMSPVTQFAPVLGAAATGKIVAILVGPEKKRYSIHKDIICHYSGYFRAAYNGRWKESDEGVVLEDVEVGVFNVFVHWLYRQRLDDGPTALRRIVNGDKYKKGHDDNFDNSLWLLKAHVFGNRFLVADFERVTHNQYVDYWPVSYYCVAYSHVIAYQNLPEDSLILKMMVDMQCLTWMPGHDDDDDYVQMRLDLPKEFLIQVMLKLASIRDLGSYKEEVVGDDYHMQKKTTEEVGK